MPASTASTKTARHDLTDGVHDNLRNLGLDALDVVNMRVGGFAAPEPGSIEEQVTVLAELKQQGLIRHIGVSNVNREQIGWDWGVSAMTEPSGRISQRTRFQVAMALAIVAVAVQLVAMPLFVEGAESPAEDVLDLGVGGALIALLGWHWEFAPSFVAKLVPGVDLVPFWTLAVANVYRRWKALGPAAETPQ